ncbi:MAG: hypothetical protein RMM17_10260 [Acidobacteriota bacterium]|nr:DUF2934 domain-containing protein [Blastocatellia bacterium]MDW8413052.1 hypothetical protein [Acidobacteriota bacterium]
MRELIKQKLREDPRVKRLIELRAYEIYSARKGEGESDAVADWYAAEKEVLDGLVDLLAETQSFAWRADGCDRTLVALVGWMLASCDLPSQADLVDARYYTIGLSYLTGMFEVGAALDEEDFIRRFGNSPAILRTIAYKLLTSPESPYYSQILPPDLRLEFDDEAGLNKYLEQAELQARAIYAEVRKLLVQ